MTRIDPHIHSVYSHDCIAKPKDIIKKARRKGLDAIDEAHAYQAYL